MFITFEGIDGSGKTTQTQLLAKELKKQNYRVEVFREPGGTAASEKVRELLLSDDYDIHAMTEMLLFSAARSQLTTEKIQPLLKENTIVILDRFYDSTLAYQGYGRKISTPAKIKEINKAATQNLVPDLTFYLKIPFEKAMERMERHSNDRIEQSGRAFYKRVLQGYDKICNQEERFKTVDATQPVSETHSRVLQVVKPLLSKKNSNITD